MDETYTAVIKALREDKSKHDVLSLSENPCREYVGVWECFGLLYDRDDTLLTIDVKRLVVLMLQHQNILKIYTFPTRE